MKNHLHLFIALSLLVGAVTQLHAQGTAFTYQGRLTENGAPANGLTDFTFTLYDAGSGGATVGSSNVVNDLAVSDGLFTATLDFGAAFDGNARWLEIAVRPGASVGAYTKLDPRQPITATPYASHADSARTMNTTANQPVNLKVNGTPVLRLEEVYGIYGPSVNSLGGYSGNIISNGVTGGFIGGGGRFGLPNSVGGLYATVVGGAGNSASGNYSTAMGLQTDASGQYSIAMGNETRASGNYSTAMGFSSTASGNASTAIGAGATASGHVSTAMGLRAQAMHNGSFVWADHQDTEFTSTADNQFLIRATGGVGINKNNPATALDVNGTVTAASFSGNGAGLTSLSAANLSGSVPSAALTSIPAGNLTGSVPSAALTSIPAGNLTGTIADARQSPNVALLDANQTFTGNNTIGPAVSLSFGSQTRQMLNLYGPSYGLGVQASSLYFRCDSAAGTDGFIWYKGGVHNDGYANAGGGVELMHLVQGSLYVNGALVPSSDRNAKENFAPVQPRAVLEKVVALPLSSWNYKVDTATRHLGPMAQDFYAAFNIGPDDKHIATVDADGVALAAIQGLNQKLEAGSQKSEDRIQKLETENAELKQRLEKLEQLMNQKN